MRFQAQQKFRVRWRETCQTDIINLKEEWQNSLTYTQNEPSTEGDQLPSVVKTVECRLYGVSERPEDPESSQEVIE